MSEARKLQTSTHSQDEQDLREVRRLLFSDYAGVIEELSLEIENLEKMISDMDLSSEKVRESYHKSWVERFNNIPGWVLGSSLGLFLPKNSTLTSYFSKSKISSFLNIPFIMLVVFGGVMLMQHQKIINVKQNRTEFILAELLNKVRKQGVLVTGSIQEKDVYKVSGVKTTNINTKWLTVRFKVLTGRNLVVNWVPVYQLKGPQNSEKTKPSLVSPVDQAKPKEKQLSLKDDIPDSVVSVEGVDGKLKISGVAPKEWVEKVISEKAYKGVTDFSQLQTVEKVFEGSFSDFPIFLNEIDTIGTKSNVSMRALENFLQSAPKDKNIRIKVSVFNKNKKDFAVGRLVYNEFIGLVHKKVDKSQIKKATFTFVNRGFNEWTDVIKTNKPFIVLKIRH